MPPTPLPKSPIVDTIILFDFLVWRFHKETQTEIHASLLAQFSSKPMEALEWYLNAAKPIQTAFHVIAELRGLLKRKTQNNPQWPDSTRQSFWRFAREELSRVDLQELGVKISDMDPTDLAQLGPTDASILGLAIRLNVMVLSEDKGIRERCSGKEISVLNYEKVLNLWKQNIT
jgi:rRNA-processing protein FCF1